MKYLTKFIGDNVRLYFWSSAKDLIAAKKIRIKAVIDVNWLWGWIDYEKTLFDITINNVISKQIEE
jgi:hypothetical protein